MVRRAAFSHLYWYPLKALAPRTLPSQLGDLHTHSQAQRLHRDQEQALLQTHSVPSRRPIERHSEGVAGLRSIRLTSKDKDKQPPVLQWQTLGPPTYLGLPLLISLHRSLKTI